MAYDFNGTTSPNTSGAHRISSSPPVTAVPFTMAAWANRDSATTAIRYVMSLARTGSPADTFSFGFGSASAFMESYQNNSLDSGTYSATFTAGTWYHFAMVGTSATDRKLWIDGVQRIARTASSTPSGIDNLNIAASAASGGVFSPFDGKIAEAAVWNEALTQAEIESLADGIRPSLVKPQNLRYYVPLVRDLADYARGVALTNHNTATADIHPRRIA